MGVTTWLKTAAAESRDFEEVARHRATFAKLQELERSSAEDGTDRDRLRRIAQARVDELEAALAAARAELLLLSPPGLTAVLQPVAEGVAAYPKFSIDRWEDRGWVTM